MPQLSSGEELQEQQTSNDETVDGRLSEPRELLRGSLKDIASKVRSALDDAALGIPVFFIIAIKRRSNSNMRHPA